jgi:hypothetical protein
MIVTNSINGTSPLILHINGKASQENILNSRNFRNFDKSFSELIIESSEIVCPENLTIITFATKQVDSAAPLLRQLRRWNVPFVNLCETYNDDWFTWNNLRKIEYLKNYLESDAVTTEYVVVLDAIDVLLSQDFDQIVTRFQTYNTNCMYSATGANYPKNGNGYNFELINSSSETLFKYLNAGCVIARVDYLKEFIKRCYNSIDTVLNPIHSEQHEIRRGFEKHHQELNMSYDINTDIFLTIGHNLLNTQGNTRSTAVVEYSLEEVDGDLIFEIYRT